MSDEPQASQYQLRADRVRASRVSADVVTRVWERGRGRRRISICCCYSYIAIRVACFVYLSSFFSSD